MLIAWSSTLTLLFQSKPFVRRPAACTPRPRAYSVPFRNRKLLISRAPTKAKSQEPAYSQALNQNKVDRQRSTSRVRQADSQTGRDGYAKW